MLGIVREQVGGRDNHCAVDVLATIISFVIFKGIVPTTAVVEPTSPELCICAQFIAHNSYIGGDTNLGMPTINE